MFGNRHSEKRGYNVEWLWSDGDLVDGGWDPSNRGLYLSSGNRDDRSPSSGPRKKFYTKPDNYLVGFCVTYFIQPFVIFEISARARKAQLYFK